MRWLAPISIYANRANSFANAVALRAGDTNFDLCRPYSARSVLLNALRYSLGNRDKNMLTKAWLTFTPSSSYVLFSCQPSLTVVLAVGLAPKPLDGLRPGFLVLLSRLLLSRKASILLVVLCKESVVDRT